MRWARGRSVGLVVAGAAAAGWLVADAARGARRAGAGADPIIDGGGDRAGLADVARTPRHRRGARREAANRVERHEEHPLEGAGRRRRQEQPDRLARHRLPDQRRPRCRRGPAVHAPRHRPCRRQGEVEPGAAPGEATRGTPSGRLLRRRIGAHRRPAAVRLVRLARALRHRLHRQGAVGEVVRADADAHGVRRGQLGRASTTARWSCHGITKAPTSSSAWTRRPARRSGARRARSRRRGRRR